MVGGSWAEAGRSLDRYRPQHATAKRLALTMTLLLSWIGVLGFFLASAAFLATGYDVYAKASLVMILLWGGAGIIEIRRRRSR